jgi:hypothetical protein
MTDQTPPVPPNVPPAPAQEIKEEKPQRRSHFWHVTIFFGVLIVAALVFIDQFTPIDLRLINLRQSPEELGRQVTFVCISALTNLKTPARTAEPGRLETTVYTKIGYKAVQAAGKLDLVLKDAKGNVLQMWKNIKLPKHGEGVKWAGFPLGGWRINFRLERIPATQEAWLEATYTNPENARFSAPPLPVQPTVAAASGKTP